MEQTLFICRSVDVYGPIPPRAGRGHISGEWRIDNRIATTRCRVVSIGNELEIRLEDIDSGEIFGACPVPLGHREAAVEGAADSSRNFVLRIVDPATKRHAYLGINFAERSHAFDFNVSLTDFEKTVMREEELKKAAASGGVHAPSTSSGIIPEAAILYQKNDFSLKEGEHIRVEVKKPVGNSPGGFLARLGTTSTAAAGPSPVKLAPLAPPPSTAPLYPSGGSGAFGATAFQQATAAASPQATQQQQHSGANAAGNNPPQLSTKVVASTEKGWATF